MALFGLVLLLIGDVTLTLINVPPPCNLRFPKEQLHENFISIAMVSLVVALLTSIYALRHGWNRAGSAFTKDLLRGIWGLASVVIGWVICLSFIFATVDDWKPPAVFMFKSAGGLAVSASIVTATLWLAPRVAMTIFRRVR